MKLGLAVSVEALFAGVLVARRFGQPTGGRAHTFARRLDQRRRQRAGNPWCARGDLNPHTLSGTGT